MITFSNPRSYFQFPRNTTLSQIRQTLENRRANGMEDNAVLVRIREILELRLLKGEPDPEMHVGERVYIGIPGDLKDFLDAHPGYTIERTLDLCRRFRQVRIVEPLPRASAQRGSSVAEREFVKAGHRFTSRVPSAFPTSTSNPNPSSREPLTPSAAKRIRTPPTTSTARSCAARPRPKASSPV
ncbi:hypothetical protein BCR34DRAFT_135920 [Clohesyomyces aquaticus]|uniref:Uncharacterized protein n=1 Tax=Clohesyomyces aquaticus TaxID=1231657 RepID=A0A1Y2AAN5_9PLEO|nr:hypothetical protein BCR34DRAFT_135920 [Clohesyomyces aquaticus]